MSIEQRKNTIIEYHGQQHYELILYFHTQEKFEKRQYYDTMKEQFCINNDINYIEIRYDQDIHQILFNLKMNI